MDLGIQGKKAIVCASSKGLGKACALSLVQEGVDVIINSRNEEDLKKVKTELLEADQQSDKPKYTGEEDPNLGLDALDEARARLKKRKRVATGGRVRYQAAGSVMGDAIQSTPAMPEELGDISYEELRARLPQEVSDEIVRLLANSAEALEDFATIQTEQDIANFNKKYGVNLVLPAEG